jgi:hypothetical protein
VKNGEDGDLGNDTTFSNVVKRLTDPSEKLYSQSNNTPEAVNINDEVYHELAEIIFVSTSRDKFSDTAPTNLNFIAPQFKRLS